MRRTKYLWRCNTKHRRGSACAAPRNETQTERRNHDRQNLARPIGTAKKAEASEFAKAGVEQFEAAVKTGQESAEKAFKTGKENVDKAYKAGADALTENADKFYAAARDHLQAINKYAKAWPTMAPKIDEVAEWSKGNLDALFAAGEIAKKGAETMAGEIVAFNQAAMAEAAAAAKDLIAGFRIAPSSPTRNSCRSRPNRSAARSTRLSPKRPGSRKCPPPWRPRYPSRCRRAGRR